MLVVTLAALAFLCYLPGVNGPFIFDSGPALSNNALIRFDGNAYSAWLQALLSSDSGIFRRPLAMLSFAINYKLAPDHAALSIKLTNVLIHICNGALVYFITMKLVRFAPNTSKLNFDHFKIIGLVSASIWLLHPINVTTVLYAVQRMTQLSALFSLLAVLVYLRYRPLLADNIDLLNNAFKLGIGIFACTLIATLSKENGALIPFYLLTVEFIFFDFIIAHKKSKKLQALSISVVAVGVFIALIAIVMPPDYVVNRYDSRDFTMAQRLLTETRILWNYVGWILLPDISNMGFHHDSVLLSSGLFTPWTTLLSIIGWIAAVVLAIFYKNNFPYFSFAVMWFLVGHSLESSILPLELVYEHRNYLPALGIYLLFAGLVLRILLNIHTKAVKWAVVAFPLLALSMLLFIRSSYWQDELTLSAVNLTNHPQSIRSIYHYANVNLRTAESMANSPEKFALIQTAHSHYSKMLEKTPDNLVPLITLLYIENRYFPTRDTSDIETRIGLAAGKIRFTASEFGALSLLTECIEMAYCKIPKDRYLYIMHAFLANRYTEAAASYELARYYAQNDNNLEMAIKYSKKAVALNPSNFNAWLNLIAWQASAGNKGAALTTLSQLLTEDKRHTRLHQIIAAFD